MNVNIGMAQNILNALLIQLINLVITLDGVHWYLCKPLLALILLSQREFSITQELIINSQVGLGEVKQNKIKESVLQLMDGISLSLSTDNQDKFMTNMTNFRNDIKTTIDIHAFYRAIVSHTLE